MAMTWLIGAAHALCPARARGGPLHLYRSHARAHARDARGVSNHVWCDPPGDRGAVPQTHPAAGRGVLELEPQSHRITVGARADLLLGLSGLMAECSPADI
jgi:hypothetical protein